jgi:predicted dehydrogenase
VRFGVLGTGFWARIVHATALAAHPDHELVGIWGRDLAKAKAVGAEFDVAGYDDLDALLAQCDAVSIALPPDVQVPLAERAAAAGKHLLLEKPIALDVADADRLETAVREARVASVVFFTARFRTATATWFQQAARTRLDGGAMTWLAANYESDSPWRNSAWRIEHGALWDLGPHALSLLIPTLGSVVSVQAGAGRGDTVHLVFQHESGAASTVTLSSTVGALASGIDIWLHGEAGRLVLLPDYDNPVEAHQVAVSELAAAALTGGTHPCDVGFGRDVVAVLAACQRALTSGCREAVGA